MDPRIREDDERGDYLQPQYHLHKITQQKQNSLASNDPDVDLNLTRLRD